MHRVKLYELLDFHNDLINRDWDQLEARKHISGAVVAA